MSPKKVWSYFTSERYSQYMSQTYRFVIFSLKIPFFFLRLLTNRKKCSFFLRLAQLYTDRWYNQERVKIICDATPTARRQFKALNIMYVSVNMKWTPNINSAIRPKKKCLSSDPIFGAPTQIFFVILPKNLKNWHRAAFHTFFLLPQQVSKIIVMLCRNIS